jgi:TonB family protein
MNEIAQEEKDYGDRAVVFSSNPSERHDAGVSEYAADIRKQILGVLTYPSEARRAGWEADVTITIHVAEDGYILSVEKKKSSQHEMFDEHLINTVKAMKYLSPFPGTVREKELWLDVPFSFTMSE